MKKAVLEISGAFIFLAGFILMFGNFSGMTGNVIGNVGDRASSTISLSLLIGGMMMFVTGKYVKQTPRKISVNKRKGIRKIKLAKTTRTINYKKLVKIAKEAGYKVVEELDRTTIFSPRDEIIKDENGYPLVIKEKDRNHKTILIKMLERIIEDNKN